MEKHQRRRRRVPARNDVCLAEARVEKGRRLFPLYVGAASLPAFASEVLDGTDVLT